MLLTNIQSYLTNSSLCSCSSNSYCAWMKLQALGSLFGSLGPCLMSSVRNMTLVQQIKGLDGSCSYCGTVLLTKHDGAWSRGLDTFHFLDFIADTGTHTFRCPPMREHQCPQDRLQEQGKGKDFQVNIEALGSSPLTQQLGNLVNFLKAAQVISMFDT